MKTCKNIEIKKSPIKESMDSNDSSSIQQCENEREENHTTKCKDDSSTSQNEHGRKDSHEKLVNQSIPVKNIPSGISDKHWERFQALKQRRQDVSKRSTEKRVRKLKEDIMRKVEKEFVCEHDLEVLRKHNVEMPGSSPKKLKIDQSKSSSSASQSTCPDKEEKWKEVKIYLGCNDHLKGIDRGKYAPKTKLEEEVDTAIEKGDFKNAEELSDKLAQREFGKTVADAFDAKNYAARKEVEKNEAKEKKKKKLHWGFEHKKRWETKSNM